MSKPMSYRTDRQRVHGLGAAGEGVEHWWHQRLTSIALVPLTLLFIFPFVRSLGAEHASVLETYSSPFHAVVAVLFLLVGFLHLQQGLQVVIEDYIGDRPTRTGLVVANTLLCWAFALAGVFAVAKIAFSA
jgi:succinate dehydrogenase / fumarate reductase, membrane anchor subunit